jgi:hypothetical protein
VLSDARLVDRHLLDYGPGTALPVVDVHIHFADPSGPLFVPWEGGVVDTVNAEICRVGARGAAGADVR